MQDIKKSADYVDRSVMEQVLKCRGAALTFRDEANTVFLKLGISPCALSDDEAVAELLPSVRQSLTHYVENVCSDAALT